MRNRSVIINMLSKCLCIKYIKITRFRKFHNNGLLLWFTWTFWIFVSQVKNKRKTRSEQCWFESTLFICKELTVKFTKAPRGMTDKNKIGWLKKFYTKFFIRQFTWITSNLLQVSIYLQFLQDFSLFMNWQLLSCNYNICGTHIFV